MWIINTCAQNAVKFPFLPTWTKIVSDIIEEVERKIKERHKEFYVFTTNSQMIQILMKLNSNPNIHNNISSSSVV